MHPKRNAGFTLVELSIVLVILGLLVGGVLSGQSLIRAAELRTVNTDTQRTIAAIYTFRDKYFALPGDMRNATRFWGAASTDTATCKTTASTDKRTCDGDGNGQVGDATNEMFRFWQHLANAGLIEGSYIGVAIDDGSTGSAVTGSVPGQNIPKGRLSNSGFSISYFGSYPGDAATYQLDYGHVLWFGGQTGQRPQGVMLKPDEAWNIDTKLDDGLPARGAFIARSNNSGFGTATACTSSANNADLTGEYKVQLSSVVCSFMIKVN